MERFPCPQENDPARSEQDVHDERRELQRNTQAKDLLKLLELLAQYFAELPYSWVMLGTVGGENTEIYYLHHS